MTAAVLRKTRVIVADRRAPVREKLALHLSHSGSLLVIGRAETGADALDMCGRLAPDILILEAALTTTGGDGVLARVRATWPKMRIVVMAEEPSVPDAFSILGQGAIGLLHDRASSLQLGETIRSVALGYAVFPHDFLDGFMLLRQNVTRTGNLFGLSPRELEVLEASSEGKCTREIAMQLNISVRTVETHRSSIYRKTDCHAMSDLPGIMRKMTAPQGSVLPGSPVRPRATT